MISVLPSLAAAQEFDFAQLERQARTFTVIIDMKLEMSFGIQTADHQERFLGTIVTEDGLVLFNGALLGENMGAMAAPFTVKTTPTRISVTTLDGHKYEAGYIGVDRFTQIGFIRIIGAENERFTPVQFRKERHFRAGEWVALYMLLPEFVSPPFAADIGMVSSVIESPEYFPLTVGFSPIQMTSVLFDEDLEPIGVLGALANPSRGSDAGGMLESFDQSAIPLLGVIVGERLEGLIAAPPVKGQPDRGWLGITLQALTEDMAEFWGLPVSEGIIVNDLVANSPAEQAGLKVADIIYQVNDQPVQVDKEEELPIFQRFIAEFGPDASIDLSILRRNAGVFDTLTLTAQLSKAPLAAAEAPTYDVAQLEFKVRELVFADLLFFKLAPNAIKGVVVSELKSGGLAELGGLELGDIIQRIGNTAVASTEEVRAAFESLAVEHPAEIVFFVWRSNQTLFVNVKTDWQ
ncbi:MAG TPA: PDZ domain-containing protein [Candidatus Deferrimicrobium sp.]|nr:PDZ domain-containing protein [Candidatus Deferrimicrobium sp.]